MKRAPWFKFFPELWLSSRRVRAMSLELRGAFLELLCHAWVDNGLPDDEDELAGLLGVDAAAWAARFRKRVLDAFPVAEDGRRRNVKQEAVRAELTATSAARAAGGKARWRAADELSSSSAQAQDELNHELGESTRAGTRASSISLLSSPLSESSDSESESDAPAKAEPRKRRKRGEGRQPQPWRHLLADFPNLDVPGFCFAMDEYMAHRAERGADPYTAPGLRQRVRELSEWGVPRSLAAIRFTMGRNWIGIREESQADMFGNNGRPRPVERNNIPAPYDLSGMPEELRA